METILPARVLAKSIPTPVFDDIFGGDSLVFDQLDSRLDLVADGVVQFGNDRSGQIFPQLRYANAKDMLTIRHRLIMNGKIIAEDSISANMALAKRLADRIASLVIPHP